MPSRFAVAVLFASISIYISYAQQVTSDVVVSGAPLNDGYMSWDTCGADGQLYRRPSVHLNSIQRVAPDGSTMIFALPGDAVPHAIAPAGTGLNIMASDISPTEGRIYGMHRFDSQGDLLTQHRVLIDFQPTEMAVTSSGKTIVLGRYDDISQDWKYGGAPKTQ